MSTSYPTLTETQFPNSVDSMSRMSDLTASDLTYVNQYYTYYNAGNMAAAAQVLIDHNLTEKIFNAAKFNKIVDGIVAMQKFFREDSYLYKGEYSSTTSYNVGNVVFVTSYGCGYICLQNCTGQSPTEGASNTYWGLISLRGSVGPQGVPGTNANPSTSDPVMDGTASAGSANAWSRGDHVHPTDTSRAAASHTHAAGTDITGTLGVAHGGTGKNFLTDGSVLVGKGYSAVDGLTGSGALYAATTGSPQFGTLPAAYGGTGKSTLTHGAVLCGSGASPVATLSGVGALYASTANNPQFGILPVMVGGSGKNTHTSNAVLVGNGGSPIKEVSSVSGALYSTGSGAEPQFGVLPVAQGGTGATSKSAARAALGITSGTSAPSGGEDGDIYIQYS